MGIFPTDPTKTQHHHRRSSQLAASNLQTTHSQASPSEGCSGLLEAAVGGLDGGEQQTAKEEPFDHALTDSETAEMDFLNSDNNINDDEETGLTTHERRKRVHMRRRQRRDLDSRIVDTRITVSGRRIADRTVIKKLAINTVFILLWYMFSLAISVVSYVYAWDHGLALPVVLAVVLISFYA